MLDLSSDYLFAAAENIPHFTRDTTAQLLKDNVFLLEGMREGLENQTQILKLTYGPQQELQHQRFEADYRTQFASALDELKMFGIPKLDGARQPLTVAFVHMGMAHTVQEDESQAQLSLLATEGEDPFAKRVAKYKNLFQPDHDKTVTVGDVFTNNHRLVVVARAGYGKTTLLKWAAVQIARNMPDIDVPLWQDRIPFFVQLRDYIHRDLPSIADSTLAKMASEWVFNKKILAFSNTNLSRISTMKSRFILHRLTFFFARYVNITPSLTRICRFIRIEVIGKSLGACFFLNPSRNFFRSDAFYYTPLVP